MKYNVRRIANMTIPAVITVLLGGHLEAKELSLNCISTSAGVCFRDGECHFGSTSTAIHRSAKWTFTLNLGEHRGQFRWCGSDDKCLPTEEAILNTSRGDRLSIWNGGGEKLNQTVEISGDHKTYSSSLMTTTGEVIFEFGDCQ
jgi:hypothetical protein